MTNGLSKESLLIMLVKYSFILFFAISFLISSHINGQENNSDTFRNHNINYNKSDTIQYSNSEFSWRPSTSIYFEFGGKGVYSVNVDFRKKEKHAVSIGIQYFDAIWPSVMYYYFGGERYRFETGLGVSGIITEDGLEAISLNGVMGYRYQKKKGLIFRAGFTPFFGIPLKSEGDYLLLPLIGLSLGYSF